MSCDNTRPCPCTAACPRHGKCCECVAHHRDHGEGIPGCFFSPEAEATYDRSVEALAEQYEGKVLVAKVNVDEEPELARAFGVMSIPTVVFLKNGREFDRKVGLMPAGAFTAVLDSNL